MITLITLVVSLFLVVLGKKMLGKWINHVSIYTISWASFIVLYELQFISYTEITTKTYIIVVLTFFAFLMGVATIFTGRSVFNLSNNPFEAKNDKPFNLFLDGGRKLEIAIYITAVIGFVTAFQHWYVLINKFGSIAAVLLKGNQIYSMRIDGEIKGTIPYVYIIAYSGVVLSGIYTAYVNKLKIVAILPMVGVILKDIASVGRAGIFIGFLFFFISFFVFKNALANSKQTPKQSKSKLIFGIIILLALIIASATAVKSMRGTMESYKASSRALNKLNASSVITPSIYLYFSSNIAVLSKYFDKETESAMLGENTFLPVYNIISQFGIIKHPKVYPKGYYIPMWSNSATYLRDIHSDFGYIGLFLVPYLLGLLCTFLWFKYYETFDSLYLTFLIYITLIVAFSIFYMVTRAAIWIVSLVFVIGIIKYIEHINFRDLSETISNKAPQA